MGTEYVSESSVPDFFPRMRRTGQSARGARQNGARSTSGDVPHFKQIVKSSSRSRDLAETNSAPQLFSYGRTPTMRKMDCHDLDSCLALVWARRCAHPVRHSSDEPPRHLLAAQLATARFPGPFSVLTARVGEMSACLDGSCVDEHTESRSDLIRA